MFGNTKAEIQTLRDRVEELERAVESIRSNQQHIEPPPEHVFVSMKIAEDLTATQIMDRFRELYNFLGVDRKHTHAKTELVKVKK